MTKDEEAEEIINRLKKTDEERRNDAIIQSLIDLIESKFGNPVDLNEVVEVLNRSKK